MPLYDLSVHVLPTSFVTLTCKLHHNDAHKEIIIDKDVNSHIQYNLSGKGTIRLAFLAQKQSEEVFCMSVDVLSHDLSPRDEQYPATLLALTFESHGEHLLGRILPW